MKKGKLLVVLIIGIILVFLTGCPSPGGDDPTVPPETVTGMAPITGSSTLDTTPTLSWNEVAGAVNYEIQIAGSEAELESSATVEESSTTYTPTTALLYQLHYWRIRAVDGAGLKGTWSTASSLVIFDKSNPNTLNELKIAVATEIEIQGNNANLNDIDVSAITSMIELFKDNTTFNGVISGWNTANVTNMSRMFYEANAFNGDISGWNTANVTNMREMFYKASVFNKDINTNVDVWNTSQVTDMSYMFYGAWLFNGDISEWNTANVKDMSYMFYSTNAFNGDISGWNTANVTDMNYMFSLALVFNQNISTNGDVWNTGQVTDMSGLFSSALAFNGDISGWNTENVTDMSYMFYSASSFKQELETWNVQRVTDFYNMFGSSGLTTTSTPDIPSWYTN